MGFNEKLNSLIFKYGVDKCCPNYRKYVEASALAKTLYFSLKSQGKKYFLFGIDEVDFEAFRAAIGSEDDCQMKYYKEISNIEPGSNVLLISYYQKDEVAVKLLEQNVNLVSLYDFFEEKGLQLTHNFYDIYNEQYWDGNQKKWVYEYGNIDVNRVYFYHRRRYELEPEGERKKFYLQKMIFDCVYVKDFLTLKENIDKYSLAYGEQPDNYVLFYQEVETLLEELKTVLATRKSEDVIVFWLDALEYGMDETMPFLKGLDEKALVFNKAFTVTPYTSPTFLTLLTGKLQIEDETYRINTIGEKDSLLVSELQKRGYRFKYYGKAMNRYSEQSILSSHFYRSIDDPVTLICWDVMIDLIEAEREQNSFYILHELPGTHPPFLSFGLKGIEYKMGKQRGRVQAEEILQSEQSKKRILESRGYVDRQLEFWNNMLPDRMYKIYMSDHGITPLGKFHTIMKVQQKDIRPSVCNSLFSYADFIPMVLQLLDNHAIDENVICREYALIQEPGWYDKGLVSDVVSDKKYFSEHTDSFSGRQGVVTEVDMLMCLENGFEYYQKYNNDYKMVTDSRLNYLRGLVSKKKPDYFHADRFRYARILIVAEQKYAERTKNIRMRKWEVIENIFSQIQDDEILAIRGGGFHTLHLLMPLKESLRNKVKYIIDGDRECVAGKMGIEVITLDEMLTKGVSTVLVSSYYYLQEWEQELKTYAGIKIINIYRILEERGLPCEMEVCFERLIEEDFDLSSLDD